MKSEQYHGFELPEYFTFDEILKYVRETIGDSPLWFHTIRRKKIDIFRTYQ